MLKTLAISSTCLIGAAAAAHAEAPATKALAGAGLTVTSAELSVDNTLVITGTAARPRVSVSIVGTAFSTRAAANRQFKLTATYRSPDCRLSLRGPTGTLNLLIGNCAPLGTTGRAGTDGKDGAKGPAGDAGPDGRQGKSGPDGKDGPAGPQGPAGPDGAPGFDMLGAHISGDGTASSQVGLTNSVNAGSFYILTFNRDIRYCTVRINVNNNVYRAGRNNAWDSAYYTIAPGGNQKNLSLVFYTQTSINANPAYFNPDSADVIFLCPKA